MYFGQTQPYRLGDLVRSKSQIPDGDYVGAIDPSKISAAVSQSTNKAQIKVTAFFPQLGVEHTWWYNIHPDNIWALAQDLIASGMDANTEIPLPQDQAEPWVGPLQQFWANKILHFHLETNKKDYQNTSIRGIAQPGPGAGLPGGGPTAVAPAPAAPPPAAAPSAPAGNANAFDLAGAGGGPVTGFSFMRPHTGPGGAPSVPLSQPVGPVGPTPGAATDLFRRG